jgi:hypothetical protein
VASVDSSYNKDMSLKLTVKLTDGDDSYSKSDTVSLTNIVTQTYQNTIADHDDEGKIVDQKNGTISNSVVIYFSSDKELNVQTSVEPTYTIADKLNLLSTSSRYKGQFDSGNIKDESESGAYKPGDIVTYNGFTYMRTATFAKDRYTRRIYTSSIQKADFGDYYFFNFDNKFDLYVKNTYIKVNKNNTYSFNFVNGAINCVVGSSSTINYLKSHSLEANDPYFDVILRLNGSNSTSPSAFLVLAPGACIEFGSGTYIYGGWERLSTDAYTTAPTETPEAAEFDPYSTYLPGDLVTYNGYLYCIQYMSLGTSNAKGHKLADSNRNLVTESGTWYGVGNSCSVTMGIKIGKYEGDDNGNDVLDTLNNNSNQTTYSFKVSSYFTSSEIISHSSAAASTRVCLQYWWKDQSNSSEPGYYSKLPTYTS